VSQGQIVAEEPEFSQGIMRGKILADAGDPLSRRSVIIARSNVDRDRLQVPSRERERTHSENPLAFRLRETGEVLGAKTAINAFGIQLIIE
jgi:hypothetical protein